MANRAFGLEQDPQDERWYVVWNGPKPVRVSGGLDGLAALDFMRFLNGGLAATVEKEWRALE